MEKKQLVDKSAELAKENTVVCFVNISEGKATVLLNCSEDTGIDAPELLGRVLSKCGGKGGGRGNFAMGSADEKYAEDITKEIVKILGHNS